MRAKRTGHVLTLALDAPELTLAAQAELLAAFRGVQAARADAPSVVVLRGAASHFCTGGDLREFATLTPEANARAAREFAQLLWAIASCPAYVVAAAHGSALGGGVGLLCACDYAVCRKPCCFQLPEVRSGLPPAVVSPYVLRRVGASAFKRWALTGSAWRSAEAHARGLVDEVCETGDEVDARVRALCEGVEAAGAPLVARIKALEVEGAARGALSAAHRDWTHAQLAEARAGFGG